MLVQHNLISSTAASDIMTRWGATNRDKAGEFVRSVEVKLQSSKKPQELFEQFVEILAAEGEQDLAETIMKNYGKGIHIRA